MVVTNTYFVLKKFLINVFSLINYLKLKNSAKHTLFLGFYVGVVIKIDVIVIIVIKKEDINKGGQLYSCFYYK